MIKNMNRTDRQTGYDKTIVMYFFGRIVNGMVTNKCESDRQTGYDKKYWNYFFCRICLYFFYMQNDWQTDMTQVCVCIGLLWISRSRIRQKNKISFLLSYVVCPSPFGFRSIQKWSESEIQKSIYANYRISFVKYDNKCPKYPTAFKSPYLIYLHWNLFRIFHRSLWNQSCEVVLYVVELWVTWVHRKTQTKQ